MPRIRRELQLRPAISSVQADSRALVAGHLNLPGSPRAARPAGPPMSRVASQALRGTTSASTATATPRRSSSAPDLLDQLGDRRAVGKLARLAVDASPSRPDPSGDRRPAAVAKRAGRERARRSPAARLRRAASATASAVTAPAGCRCASAPVAQTRPVERARPDDRRVVRRRRAQPRRHLDQLELGDARKRLVGRAQQLEHSAGGDRRVGARAPPRSRPRPLARPRAARCRPRACRTTRRAIGASRSPRRRRIWPFTGRTARGRRPVVRRARPTASRRRPRPGRRRCARPTRASTPVTRSDSDGHSGDRRRRAEARRRHARAPRSEPRRERARRHLVVDRRANPADDARGEARLQRPALRRAQPFRIELERELELVQPPQQLGLVAVERHGQRAATAGSRSPLRSRSRAPRRSPGSDAPPRG